MDIILQMILIGFAILFSIFILVVTKKKQLSYRYTLLWLFLSFLVIVVSLFPQIITSISKLIHIKTPVNTLFLMVQIGLTVIIFLMSIGYSKHAEKITRLIQENALLEKRIRDFENDKKEKE